MCSILFGLLKLFVRLCIGFAFERLLGLVIGPVELVFVERTPIRFPGERVLLRRLASSGKRLEMVGREREQQFRL